eukprot:s492_g16.t1
MLCEESIVNRLVSPVSLTVGLRVQHAFRVHTCWLRPCPSEHCMANCQCSRLDPPYTMLRVGIQAARPCTRHQLLYLPVETSFLVTPHWVAKHLHVTGEAHDCCTQ